MVSCSSSSRLWRLAATLTSRLTGNLDLPGSCCLVSASIICQHLPQAPRLSSLGGVPSPDPELQCHATHCAMWVCMMHGLLYIPPWECHLELEYPGWMWISDSDVAEQSKRYRQRRRRLRWTRNRLRCAKASWRQRSLRKVLRKLT